MNGCSLFGCSARSNRLCENGCPDFSLLLLLGADEQIFGVNEQILGQDQSDERASARPWWPQRMLRSLLAQSLELPEWPSTPRCIGDIGNENLRQHCSDDGNLYRHLLGIH